MKRHDFTQEQVDRAIEYVVENGAKDRGSTISYSRVFIAADMIPPQDLHFGGEGDLVTKFMAAFHYRCRERQYPPLDALVVHVAGERQDWPGGGYFKVNGLADPLSTKAKPEQAVAATNFWQEEKRQCEAWGTKQRRSK